MLSKMLSRLFVHKNFVTDIVSRLIFGYLFISFGAFMLSSHSEALVLINNMGMNPDSVSNVMLYIILAMAILIAIPAIILKKTYIYLFAVCIFVFGFVIDGLQAFVNLPPSITVLAGICLTLGLFTRITAGYCLFIAIQALVLYSMGQENLFAKEHFYVICISIPALLFLAITGPGRISFDYLISNRVLSDNIKSKPPLLNSLFLLQEQAKKADKEENLQQDPIHQDLPKNLEQ